MKVEKLPKKKASDGDDYIVELKNGRTVQLQINPYCAPYFYQPLSPAEIEHVMALIAEFNAANK